MNSVRILIVDDHEIVRQGLRLLLSTRLDWSVCGEAADGVEAVEKAKALRPDVVLMDLSMPRMSGVEATRIIHNEIPAIKVIIVSQNDPSVARIQGRQIGATALVPKMEIARALLPAIESAVNETQASEPANAQATAAPKPLNAASDMLIDVTAKEHAVDASNLLAAIVDSSDDAIASKSLDGVITSWNKSAERLFGYTAQEAIGRHITMIVPPERLDEESHILDKLRRGERVEHIETIRLRKDGTLIDISSTISPIRDASGAIIGASNVARDITERKRANEALRNSEEQLRRLTERLDAEVREQTKELEERNAELVWRTEQIRELSLRLTQIQDDERRHIARELHDSAGQTLTVLGMFVAALKRKVRPDLRNETEEAQQLVQQLSQEIRTMSYLLHPPLLDEAGLSSALQWYVSGLIERSGLQIRLSVPEDFGRLSSGLELVIFRLIQECLTNVHRHSGSKAAAIRLFRKGDMISLEVRDSGKGISPERLAEIQTKNSGVGIRGMRERVQQFSGEMKIESDHTGTRVSVAFPALNADSSTERKEPHPAQFQGGGYPSLYANPHR